MRVIEVSGTVDDLEERLSIAAASRLHRGQTTNCIRSSHIETNMETPSRLNDASSRHSPTVSPAEGQTWAGSKLKDYGISEETGFLAEFPQRIPFIIQRIITQDKISDEFNDHSTSFKMRIINQNTTLPSYFFEWDRIGKDIPALLANGTLRTEIGKMSLLDHRRLQDDRERRLALTLLACMGNAYVWADGDKGVPKTLPATIAVPWCALVDYFGCKPIICHFAFCLNNWKLLDPEGARHFRNMDVICAFPGAESFRYFVVVTAQTELDAVPGIKAVVRCQKAVVDADVDEVVTCLEIVKKSIDAISVTTMTLKEHVDPGVFYNTLRPFLSGWCGEGNPLSNGLIYEGVSSEPVKLIGGSAAQASTLATFDAFLGMVHTKDEQTFLDTMLEYMISSHRQFVLDVRNGPSVREFVKRHGRKYATLVTTYNACLTSLSHFRSEHIKLVTSFIIIPSRSKSTSKKYEDVSQKGTGGSSLVPFLRKIRDGSERMMIDPDQNE